MLIILEGVDGVGKSTLAERLCDVLGEGALTLHSGPLDSDPLKEYEWRLKDYTPGSGQHIVCDRWHVGELIYGPLYRGVSRVTPAMRRHIELFLDKLGAHKVVVVAPYRTIMRRLEDRGEDFLQSNHVGMVWDFYNEYASQHGWVTTESDAMVDFLTSPARRAETAAERLRPYRTYVGPPHPKHLLLGETQGRTRHGRPAYEQCFVPYPDTSGHYLLDAVNFTGVQDIGLANAADEDVETLWHILGRPNVIALGAEAEKAARDVPHRTVHHPSYARRFRSKDVREYAREIKELLT